MHSVLKNFKNSHLWGWLGPRIIEPRILSAERSRFLSEARACFSQGCEHGSLTDYKNALKRHRVTFGEYMYRFEYWRLNEAQRDSFISCSEMQCIYRKTVQPEVKTIFWDKSLFLQRFSGFVNRDWIDVKHSDYERFRAMLLRSDCIVKPKEGWRGRGVSRISRTGDDALVRELYEDCIRNDALLEECIHACPEIEEFHPQSLNTLRVVTISNPDRCVVFGAILRMGTGDSIIDNTHNGGVYASIDVDTGIIETDGLDSSGNKYIVHPDSGKAIKGFKIPYWDKVVETVEKASKVLPKLVYAGWDVVVMEEGRIALIEGNHAPDFDGGMQAPKKIGVKQKLRATVQELQGFDPLRYVSVRSGAINGYRYNERVAE